MTPNPSATAPARAPAGADSATGRRGSPWGRVGVAVFALALLGLSCGSLAADGGIFGSLEVSSDNMAAIPQWLSVMQRIRAERDAFQDCDADSAACASPRVRDWRQALNSLRGSPAEAQISGVNSYINSIVPYITDYQNYGVSDYWASPLEFLNRSGDCEDYAIAKFVSLLDLGHPNETMRIVVVNDIVRNLAHAVLAVDRGGQVLILDSLINEVRTDRNLPQYVPQYSVNLDTRWAHIMR